MGVFVVSLYGPWMWLDIVSVGQKKRSVDEEQEGRSFVFLLVSTPVFTFKKFTGKKKKSVIYILQWSLMKEMINNPSYVPDMSQKPAGIIYNTRMTKSEQANASVTTHM